MALRTFDEVISRFRDIDIPKDDFDIIVAIANGGIVPAGILCRRLGLPVYLLKINLRDEQHRKLYDKPKLLQNIDFDYSDKRILLVEDRVKTGTTLAFAKSLLEERARSVKTFAVNGKADYSLFDESCFPFPYY